MSVILYFDVFLQYQHCFTNSCRISIKEPPQSSILYFVVPDQISNISYSRISGNKWHVKFALSFIILQQYTRLSITKWRSLEFQLGICLWNTDAPAATESKYGKHLHVIHFDTHGGAWGVTEVRGSNRWTYNPSLFTVSSPNLSILHAVSGTELRTDRQTNGRTDRRSHY